MRRTDQTLLEQMKISDLEISRRMALLSIDQSDLQLLESHKIFIEENIDRVVDTFYKKQTDVDEIALLIGDADSLNRLRNAQRRYVIDLFSGNYDRDYVNNRLRIGLVHKRIGVEPKLYLSGVNSLKEIVGNLLKEKADDNIAETLCALDKLIYFDTTLVFDTYIDSLVGEIESAKQKTEEYASTLEEKVAERTLQLERQAQIDPLTNLYNQRAMYQSLNRELATAKRRQTKLSLVYFDVDNFKSINDQQGHIAGDEVLKQIGESMLGSIREIDVACRYGGDEFCLILPECDIENARPVCERIIERFTSAYPKFSISMGIAETGPLEHLDSEAIIKNADEKMYLAKKEDGPTICS